MKPKKTQKKISKKPLKKVRKKDPHKGNFTIVGLGGSAGALAAFENFFVNMPLQSGIAFVLVQHLDPKKESLLPEIIKRNTHIPVILAKDGAFIEPDHIYTMPPDKEITIKDGKLHLSKARDTFKMPIDIFLKSLAEQYKEKAAGVIFSGMGKDGTEGIKAIKKSGGLTLVQKPSTATFDSMPRSAIETGMIDHILAPEELPAKLFEWTKNGKTSQPEEVPLGEEKTLQLIQKIFDLIHNQTGHDFSLYKITTVSRRIESRMSLHKIRNLNTYVSYLQDHPEEIDTLFKELLIGVTNFFRDAEAFENLKTKLLPPLLRSKKSGDSIRVWVTGCSTGDEAFSLAIILKELLEEMDNGNNLRIQIFATDIDDEAIDQARTGSFPIAISKYISEERLERFFKKQSNNYVIKKEIREMVVFATHSVIKDPPFTKIDLLCCRNLLIYLKGELQKKLIYMFHYCINPNGILFLGASETLGGYTDLFLPLDAKWRIFQKRESVISMKKILDLPINIKSKKTINKKGTSKMNSDEIKEISDAVQKILLENFAPPSVVINKNGDILYVNGHTGKYLELPSGQATMNIFDLAREGLKFDLRSAVQEVATLHNIVIRKDLFVKIDSSYQQIRLKVKPFTEPGTTAGLMVVIFEDETSDTENKKKSGKQNQNRQVTQLQKELNYTKKHLQDTIEEMEASLEELTSNHEEAQSTNEELQSSNEELTTSKEEMQSLNEELSSVNAELQAKMSEHVQVSNDMKNLLQNTDTAIVFLDNNLYIKRFSPGAAKIIQLIPTDVGRPVSDMRNNIKNTDIVKDVNEVLESLTYKKMEVQVGEDRWYIMRISPYRTVDNFIDGVVITFTDITKAKKLNEELQESKMYSESIVETMRSALLVLDDQLRIISANRMFYQMFKNFPEKIIGKSIFEIAESGWNIPDLKKLLLEILPQKKELNDFYIEHKFSSGFKALMVNAKSFAIADEKPKRILLTIEDITDKKK